MKIPPISVAVDPHYSPRFYAELWGISEFTVLRLFRDLPGVLKLEPSKNGRRARREIKIPLSLAMKVHEERSK